MSSTIWTIGARRVERRLLSTLRPGQIYRPEVEWISLPFPFLTPSSNGAERDRHASRKKALLLPGEAEGRGEEFLDGGNGGALRSGFGPHGGADDDVEVVLVFRLTHPGTFTVQGVSVRYHSGGRSYVAEYPQRLTACAPLDRFPHGCPLA